MTTNIRLGYDDNLGLPNDFSAKTSCEIVPYHDLAQLIAAYQQQQLDALFIPAGTLPYLDNYQIISQSLFGDNYSDTLQSNFVTTKKIILTDIPSHSIGRVNQYCTTSFWSPLIYLMDYLPKNTILKFTGTNGFPDLLHKTASGMLDCCMIWDIFLKIYPDDAAKVQQLFVKKDLPTPVIAARKDFPAAITDKINQFTSNDSKAFFRKFQAVNQTAIQKFLSDMQKAIVFYQLKIDKG